MSGIKVGQQLLYLSRANVLSLGITAAEITAAVERAFLAQAEGRGWTHPKLYLRRPDGKGYHAKAGTTLDPPFATLKWLGYFPGNAAKGLPDFRPLIVLNEGETGQPVAFMDATWITEIRTGSMTAIAAKRMARPGPARVGFIACGVQARGNFEALRAVLPVRQVVAYSRRLATAETFAAWVRERGVPAEAVADPKAAIAGVDILVSSIPQLTPSPGGLDARLISPGTFVSMIDLGYGWDKTTLGVLERVVTDDPEETGPKGSIKLNYEGPIVGGLAGIVSGTVPGRVSDTEINALVFSGVGLADVGPAALVYETAVERGVGTVLEL